MRALRPPALLLAYRIPPEACSMSVVCSRCHGGDEVQTVWAGQGREHGQVQAVSSRPQITDRAVMAFTSTIYSIYLYTLDTQTQTRNSNFLLNFKMEFSLHRLNNTILWKR